MAGKTGRPAKYTEDVIGRLEQAIAMGASFKLACQYAGITEQTLSRWRASKSGLSERLEKAEGVAAVKWLAKIEQAANTQWQAAAWKLERRYPQDYGRTVQEHQGRDGGPIQIDDASFTDVERRRRLLAILNTGTDPVAGSNDSPD